MIVQSHQAEIIAVIRFLQGPTRQLDQNLNRTLLFDQVGCKMTLWFVFFTKLQCKDF